MSATGKGQQKVCVVLPVFNEERNIAPLTKALIAALQGELFEILFVDDGSHDGTVKAVHAQMHQDSRIRLVRFTRNFGHTVAVLAGLQHNQEAAAIIIMDSDMQHPPERLPDMLASWRAGFLVVQMQRMSYENTILKSILSKAFYRLINLILPYPLIPGAPEFMLLDRQVVVALLGFQEKRYLWRGMVRWLGYKSAVLPYKELSRYAGHSSYTFWPSFKLASSALFSLTLAPLRLGFILGILGMLISIALGGYALWQGITQSSVEGWASLVLIIVFLASIQFIILGILGEYLSIVVHNIRNVPPYVTIPEDTTTKNT